MEVVKTLPPGWLDALRNTPPAALPIIAKVQGSFARAIFLETPIVGYMGLFLAVFCLQPLCGHFCRDQMPGPSYPFPVYRTAHGPTHVYLSLSLLLLLHQLGHWFIEWPC